MSPCRWYFSQEELHNRTPSRRSQMSYQKEQYRRQESVELINQTAKRLQLSQSCVMTAVVYMHRFYMRHSISKYPVFLISLVTLWLASKIEKIPRKLVDIVIHGYWSAFKVNLNPKSQKFLDLMNNLPAYEKVLLKTLGSELKLEHPHVYISQFCKFVGDEAEVARLASNLAKSSMNATTMCLRYKPSVLACLFVYITAKSRGYWHILFNKLPDGKPWYTFFEGVTEDMLDAMTKDLENSLYASDEGVSTEDKATESLCMPQVEPNRVKHQEQVSPEFINDPKTPEVDNEAHSWSPTSSGDSDRGNQGGARDYADDSTVEKICDKNNRLSVLV